MDPDVPANDHGRLTTMKRQLHATNRNLKGLVQKDNIRWTKTSWKLPLCTENLSDVIRERPLVEAVFIVHGVAKSILKFFQFLWHWVVPGNAIGCLCCLLESTLKEAGLLGVKLEHGHVLGAVGLICLIVEALPGCVILYSCFIQS